MTCSNCGAELPENALLCPYCGYENEAVAEEKHRQEISGIYAKIAALLHIPERVAARAKRILLCAVLIIVAVVAVAFLAAFLYSKLAPEAALRRQDAALEKLEQLWQNGEYDALPAALAQTERLYGGAYEKYRTVGALFETLGNEEESCAETAEFVAGFPEGADLLNYDLKNLFSLLRECSALSEAGFVYGEQDAVAELERRAHALLTETLLLTEDEIAEGIALDAKEETDYQALAELAAARLAEGKR